MSGTSTSAEVCHACLAVHSSIEGGNGGSGCRRPGGAVGAESAGSLAKDMGRWRRPTVSDATGLVAKLPSEVTEVVGVGVDVDNDDIDRRFIAPALGGNERGGGRPGAVLRPARFILLWSRREEKTTVCVNE